MNDFNLKLIIIFLICINQITSLTEYDEICPEGKYGKNCNSSCVCGKWTFSNRCSKIEGRCLDCIFGHYGQNCEVCYPTCKTSLCCIVKSDEFKGKEKNKKLKIKNSIIPIQIGDIELKILADYNVGEYLAIFDNTFTGELPLYNGYEDNIIHKYTKYNLNGTLYENVTVKFLEQNDLNIDLSVILVEGYEDETINGVIGLGFYNEINKKLYERDKEIINIASYQKSGDEINIVFGDLFKEERNYIHKLSYCESEKIKDNIFDLSCKIQGFGSKKYSDILQINNTYIQFSLDTQSKFTLPNSSVYTDYIIKYYFMEDNYQFKNYPSEGTPLFSYFCYKTENINRLNEFGFVFNHFYYFFSADNYFMENEGLCEEEGYSLFLIQFSDDNPGLIFGKNFYNETQYTIDNEEKKIYFYSKYVEYFSGEIKTAFIEDPSNVINPFNASAIVIGISLFLNIASFMVYFYMKRKQEIKKLKKL